MNLDNLLTPDGKKYARYIYLAQKTVSKIPWVGKYISAAMLGIVITVILTEGAKENDRVNRKAKMSEMRRRTSSNQGRRNGDAPKEVRSVQLPDTGIRHVSGLVRDGSGEVVGKENGSEEKSESD